MPGQRSINVNGDTAIILTIQLQVPIGTQRQNKEINISGTFCQLIKEKTAALKGRVISIKVWKNSRSKLLVCKLKRQHSA